MLTAAKAGAGTVDAATIPDILRARAAASPAALAYLELDAGTELRRISWRQFADEVQRLRCALVARGVIPGDRVAILAHNSIEWELAQHACLACGAAVAGVDPNYPQEQLDEVMRQLQPAVVFGDDAALLERVDRKAQAALKLASVFRAGVDAPATDAVALEELLRPGAPLEATDSECAADRGGLITFSSGTTGTPKPILYSHAQVCTAVRAILGAFPDLGAGERLLCWLPLANLFQRMINLCALAAGARTYVTRDPRSVMANLGAARPTVFVGVPRFFERMQTAVNEELGRAAGPLRAIGAWAIRTGARHAQAVRSGAATGIALKLSTSIADRLILRRIRGLLGGQVKYLVSGSAPVPIWLLEWFDALGLPIYEAYGVSENVLPVAMNQPGQRRLGSVGKPLSSVALAADGEILVGGPGLFNGYLQTTPESPRPDAQGFWATGDVGCVDSDGFLFVHGRKSDTFKTSTGRWVVPARVEDCLRRIPYIDHAAVVGANRKAPVAILSIDMGRLKTCFAADRSEGHSAPAFQLDKRVNSVLLADVDRALQEIARQERPAAVVIAQQGFSIAGGELTTNLKLRRTHIERRYAAALEKVYLALDQRAGRPADDTDRLSIYLV